MCATAWWRSARTTTSCPSCFGIVLSDGELDGHSFGNLFMAALSHITGDFALAVQMSSQILATRGRIYPATNTNVTLAAEMDDGSVVHGETNITASRRRVASLRLDPEVAELCPKPSRRSRRRT